MLCICLHKAQCKNKFTDSTIKAEDGVLNFGNRCFDCSELLLGWLCDNVVNKSHEQLKSFQSLFIIIFGDNIIKDGLDFIRLLLEILLWSNRLWICQTFHSYYYNFQPL